MTRPVCGEWPDEDVAWGREAIASHHVEPIDRIVATSKTKQSLIEEFRLIRSLDEVQGAGFWSGIRTDASLKMVIAEQVALLRKLCLHSQWIALINPYAFGQEQDFALQLVEMALARGAEFGTVDFEIHAKERDDQQTTRRVLNHMGTQVRRQLKPTEKVELYVWPKQLDRILVAGNYAQVSGGQKRKQPRWGVHLGHVAHGAERDTKTEWKLLHRESLDHWFREFVAEDARNKPESRTITPAT